MGVLLHRIGVLESAAAKAAHETLKTLASDAGATALYDPDNPGTWTLRDDGADLWYSAIADALGNREDMVQATAADQPKQITLSTGRRAADHLADKMLANFASTITQPNTVFVVMRGKVSAGTAYWFDSTGGSGGRQIIGIDANAWAIWAGTFLKASTTEDTDFHSFHANFNGATSELFLDGTSLASGDAGTNSLGGAGTDSKDPDGVVMGPIIVFPGLKTPAELSDIRAHIDENWPIGAAS